MVLCSRSIGNHVDVYVYTSDGTKLRSSPDLLDYISEHSQYWESFDPKLINFERNKKESFGSGTRKIINFLEEVRKGATKEEALESVRHAIKKPRPRPQNGKQDTLSHPLSRLTVSESESHENDQRKSNESQDDDFVEIIGVVKSRHERTPEIIDLSSEEIEAGSDDQN